MDFANKLQMEMESWGICIHGWIDFSNYSTWQSFKHRDHQTKSKSIRILIFDKGAIYGDWREGDTKWRVCWIQDNKNLSQQEEIERKVAYKKVLQQIEWSRLETIKVAKELLIHQDTKEASFDHPYVKRKRIIPYYAYQLHGSLLLPMMNVHYETQGLQYIHTNGFKQFKGTASSAMLIMAHTIKDEDVIWICEGWATGCTIYEVIGAPVICAFTASNIPKVTSAVRFKYPNNRILICADDDFHLPPRAMKNIGIYYAEIAAKEFNAKVFVPDFKFFPPALRGTDINDLFCLGGWAAVEKQLLSA